MNYYRRHLGDYAKKCGHLSPLEHGIYNLLMDAYYDRERAPTKAEAIRTSRARSADELAAVDSVLDQFFELRDGVYVQARIEEELTSYRARQETNRKLGARGGVAKAKRTASESLSETVANDKRTPSLAIKPLTTIQEEPREEHVPQAARFDEFWAAYPIKRGKKPALEKWKAKKLDASADRLIADVLRRVAEDEQWRNGFAPHASTYLHQERWEDEMAGRQQPRAGPQPLGKQAQAVATIQRLRDELRTDERPDLGTNAAVGVPRLRGPASG